MKYTVLILAVHLVRVFYKEGHQSEFLRRGWRAELNEGWGSLSESWRLAQEGLKVALHHYDQVLDIKEKKKKPYSPFLFSFMLGKKKP